MQQEWAEKISQLRNKAPGLSTENVIVSQMPKTVTDATKAQHMTPPQARSRSYNIILQDKQKLHYTDTQINSIL
jgi:hypothetical protein